MQKFEHSIEIDQYVRLKPNGEDALYQAACAGSPGWVRKHDHDKIGWPMVWIEWDKDHWSYNGEEDKWAIEAHFEPVEEDMSDTPPQLPPGMTPEKMMEMFAEFVKTKTEQGEDPVAPAPDVVPAESEPDLQEIAREEYVKLANAVHEQILTADSFLVVLIDRQQPEDSPVPMLIPRAAHMYQSPEGGYLLEAQLSKLAAMAHEGNAVELIERALTDKEDGSSES